MSNCNLHVKLFSVSEDEIIQGLKRGDERIFRELVDRFQKSILVLCMGILLNREDAEDIAQDVFAEVFLSVGKFRGDARLSTWIYRIAVNKSLNHVRKVKRRKWIGSLEKLPAGSESTGTLDTDLGLPGNDLEKKQLSRKLHAAIDSLPENQRTAFVLSKMEELSYKEIADVMEVTLPAVESLLHRAKTNLQKKLWNWYKKEME